jgi:hypothetical protein
MCIVALLPCCALLRIVDTCLVSVNIRVLVEIRVGDWLRHRWLTEHCTTARRDIER